MKNLLIMLVVFTGLIACQNAETTSHELSQEQKNKALKDSSNYTTIEWIDSIFQDLGKVKEGTIVEVSYRFKNTGSHNLVIADISASCGCTTPDKPQEPIAPGKEGVVKAKFNSSNRPGENRKEVYVIANTSPQSQMTLHFRVEVTK